ncbi:FecR domain-containing protein [Microbacteriaceae bacterium K1510]|nr:FecR domain-containing protein [Microbacteriaceae bacterium K1510]
MTERGSSAAELAAEHEARDWIVRLSSGAMAPDEQERLRHWLAASAVNRAAFEREQAFWQDLSILKDDFAAASPRKRFANLWRHGRAAAAAVAMVAACVFAVLWFFTGIPSRLMADHATGVGELATVSLPDGSTAMLNSDSAIDVRYHNGLRLVMLKRGEAVFNVRHDPQSTFRVAASGGNTDATGTSFAARLNGSEVTVTVAEGSVRVFGPAAPDAVRGSGEGIAVKADQQVSYTGGETPAAVHAVKAADALAWRNGSVVLDGRPFAQAISEIGRYIPERLVLDQAAQQARPVSGVFSIRYPYRAIEALAATQGLAVYRIPHVAIFIR